MDVRFQGVVPLTDVAHLLCFADGLRLISTHQALCCLIALHDLDEITGVRVGRTAR